MKNVPIATISNLLRHSSLGMTMRYAHLSPGHLTSAVRGLDPVSKQAPSEGTATTQISNVYPFNRPR